MVAPGGADRTMLRVDASRFKLRGRRRLVIWLLLIVLPVVGLLLGLFVPRGGTTIEFGSGSLFESSSGEISPVFLASEYHDTYTTLWLANAHDPDKRSRLADVPHAPGWDIEATVNPTRPAVAVLAIPPGGWDPASHASLLVISEDGVRHLAINLELRGGLLWSDDGRQLVAQRSGMVLVMDASSGALVAEWKPTGTHSAHPIAMTRDTLWVATLQSSGTSLAEVQLTESGPVTVERVKLSDGVTRDWTLSPDGSRLAFTEQHGLDLRVRVVPSHYDDSHLVSSRWSVAERPSSAEWEDVGPSASPVWRPDGRLDFGLWDEAVSETGFTLPTAWDHSGEWLALRSLDGSGPGRVVGERLAFRGPGDELLEVPDGLSFVGWWAV